MDKEDVVYVYTYTHTQVLIQWNITLSLKRNEIVPFAEMRMDLETVIQNEVSQKEKYKYCILKQIYRV